MLFFSTDVKDNHPMLAIREAKPGASEPEQVGMEHVSFEVTSFAELREVYRKFKEHKVKLHHTIFPGVAKSICFYDLDGNLLELYLQRAAGRVSQEPARRQSPVPSRLDCTYELKPEVTS
jgi:catechol-2,3-dioxygenase